MFQTTRVSTEPPDAMILAASELLAHHAHSRRWNEPGSNPASFQGRMASGGLVCDYEYGESPQTNQWLLRIAVHWNGERVFHATKRAIKKEDVEQATQLKVHLSEPGPWRESLLAFVTEQHKLCG